MDLVFSNTVFANYLMGIPKETRDKVFSNMSKLKTVKLREAIRQIGGLTRVKIERLSSQELKKYKRNNSHSYKAKPLSNKQDHDKSHSNQENPTGLESTDKESSLSLPESVETSSSKEDSISRIQEETELKPESNEEISVSSPESVLSLEIITNDNKKKTKEISYLTNKHSDKTKSHNSDLNTNNTSQTQTTKESTSCKIDQNKVDSNKDKKKINKPINTSPAHDKHKQKIINLFGDDEEIEIKIPSHKKTDTEENTKSDTTDESSKMKRKSTCENNQENNIKMTQSLGKDTSTKTDVSKKELPTRRKSTHHRDESNEEDRRIQSKTSDKSNVTETKLVHSSSKQKDNKKKCAAGRKNTHHSEDINEEKSKSSDKDISNDLKTVPSSSKTKDNREEIKARRKSIHHGEESKEKRNSRSKSRDRDVSNSTSSATSSKTKDSGKEIKARRKSIHNHEESKEKRKSRSKSRDRDVSNSTSSATSSETKDSGKEIKARRKSIHHREESKEKRKSRSKSRDRDVSNSTSSATSSKTKDSGKEIKARRKSIHNHEESKEKRKSRSKSRDRDDSNSTSSATSSKTKNSGKEIKARRKSIHNREESKEKRKSRSKSRDRDVSNSTSSATSSKTKDSGKEIKAKRKSIHNREESKEKRKSRSKSRDRDVSNSTSSATSSKTKDNGKEIKARRKSIHHREESKEKRKSRSKSRDTDVSNSTSSTTSSKTKNSGKEVVAQRKSIYHREESKEKRKSRSKSRDTDVSNSTSSTTSSKTKDSGKEVVAQRKNIYHREESKEKRKSRSKSRDTDVSNSTSVATSSKTKDSGKEVVARRKSINHREESKEKRKSRSKSCNRDVSNSTSSATSSKTKDSGKEVMARRKSIHDREDKKKGSSTPTKGKSVCIPVPEIITDTSSDSTVIIDDLSNPQTPKRSKTSSELESDSSSDVYLDAVKRKIFSSIAIKASSLTRPTVAKEVKATTPKKSSNVKEKSSTPKSSGVKDKPAPRQIIKRRITVHQDNIEEEFERIFGDSTPKRSRKEKTTMRKRSASICILPQCQETENNGVKRKRPPVVVIDSSDDSLNSEVSLNKRTKPGETPSTPTKNYLSYGDLEEQMKTTPSTSKTLDFVDPLSGSSNGFSKPNYDDDKTQDMTYDSVLIIEEKDNILPKILVRRRSIQNVEETQERIISRRHSFHFDDIQFKEEPKDRDEEVNIARESTKQNTSEKTSKDSSKPNKKPKRNKLRRQSIHEISTQLQSPNEVRPIKSILKKRPSDSNETLSNVSNPSTRRVDLNDNNIAASVPVSIDLQCIDIDKMFPTANTENAITLEISSEENSPTRGEDTTKSRLSVDSAIGVDSDIDKEAEIRTNVVSNPKDKQIPENLAKMKIELLDEIKFITTAQAVDAVKDNFVSLLYIYKQYFRMRVRVDCEKKLGKEPNLAVRMAYFSKRRDSDLSKMYDKLITFKVDIFIIETFFELIAKYLKEEFKEYKEITEAVIHYFIQGIIWILTENFTSPSDDKFLFNHITSCDCEVYLLEKADTYLKTATALDKKINAIFKDFTFKNSLDKLGTNQTETITRPSEIPSSTSVASSTITQKTVCSTLKTITTESSTTKSSVEKTPSTKCCKLMSMTLDDFGHITVPPSKSLWPPLTQQIKNLSLPIIETEDQTSMKPNPPPKRRGRPPKNLQNIQLKPAPKKTAEPKETTTRKTTRPNILKRIVQKPILQKPVPQKPPSPDFDGIFAKINQTKSFLPSTSKTPSPKVMITVSSEAYLPNTETVDLTQAARKFVTYAITFDSKSSSQAGLPQQTINGGLENNTQSNKIIPQIIPCESHDQNLSSDDELHIAEEIEEEQVDKTSNVQLTNDIISLLQHPNQKTRAIEAPKQRIITLDGLIVPQSKANTVPPKNQNISNHTLSVSAPVWTPMPAEVPVLVTSTSQATNQNITKSTTSVTTPFCTPCTFSNRKVSYDAKQSAFPPGFINQNLPKNGPQNSGHGLLKTNEPVPQGTLTSMLNNLEPTNQEQNHPINLTSNSCQNNPYVQNHLTEQNVGQNKSPPNKYNPLQAIVSQNVSLPQKSVNLGYNHPSQEGPNPHSNNQVETRPLYSNLLLQKMSNLTENVDRSQLVPVNLGQNISISENIPPTSHDNGKLEQNNSPPNYHTPLNGQSNPMGQNLPNTSRNNVNLGQKDYSQNYQRTNQRRNSSMGQNLLPTSLDNLNLGLNDSSQNYNTSSHGQNNAMGQNLPPTSRDNLNLGQNDSTQNYQTLSHEQNNPLGQNLPPTSRDNVNLGQNDYSQNYQRRNSSMGQNSPATSQDNLNLRQNDSSQNYLTPSQGQDTTMGSNLPRINLGQNTLSQNVPNVQDANQRQVRRTEERSSSLVNVMAQNGSYMVRNNLSVPVSQHNLSLSKNNSNLNQSSIQTGSTDSQNKINVLMSQNNKNIPQQLINHLNPNENDLTRLKTLAKVARSGSLREKNKTPPQKRKYNQNKSPQNNVNLVQNNQEMVRYGAHNTRNKNYEQVYQNYLHTENKKNEHLYKLITQSRQQITQNNLTMNNSMGPIQQEAQNYVPLSYPHQMAIQSGIMPIHPNQMASNCTASYTAQQIPPDVINHPYAMVPQIPMYRTQITHAVHEPVYNNLDYMRMNMTREALAQHDYYDRMMTAMERNARTLPSYEEYLQTKRLLNDNNGLHASATLEQMTQARAFHREMAQHLPQPFPVHGLNHPRNEVHQENQRRTESNTLPQPFPSHNSNHSNMTVDDSSKPKQVQRSSKSNYPNQALEIHSSSSLRHQPVASNYVQQLQEMTDKQIPSLQVPSDPKRPRLVLPNLHQIERLKHNLEQIVANTPPVERTTIMNNSALSSTHGQQSYDMDSVHISEGPPQPRPSTLRLKKNLQQDKQNEKTSAEENVPGKQMQVDVYNPALRNVSRDSGYFSPSDNAMQTLDVDGDVICDRCLAPSSLLCSGCYIIYYCSTECQQLAWPEHMKKCLEVSPLQRR